MKQTSHLKCSLVRETLMECFEDENMVEKIINKLRERRETKFSYDIKKKNS